MEFLIPEAWFAGQAQWVLLALTAVAVAVLIQGADRLVDSASGIACRFGISKVIVGASAVAAPLPIIDSSARIPEIALFVHLPTMLLILGLFRVFIFRAVRAGGFRRWYGVPLVLIYVAYTIVQNVVS